MNNGAYYSGFTNEDQEGLFKLILFSNFDDLILNNQSVSFLSKLKLTGKNIIKFSKLPP